MKKIFLSCVATSALLYMGSVYAETVPTEQPAQSEQAVKTGQPVNKQDEQTSKTEQPTQIQQSVQHLDSILPETAPAGDTFLQAELAEAFQSLIGRTDLNQKTPLVIEERGRDFIVTIPELTLPAADGERILPAQRVVLSRTDDFADMPQFKVTMDFLGKIQSLFEFAFPTLVFDADTYEQTLFWVPKLQLISNNSIRSENLTATTPDSLSATIKTLVSDQLSKQVGDTDKMDSASALDLSDFSITSPFLNVKIPHLTASGTTLGGTITGDTVLQYLTAATTTARVEIPTLSISSPLLSGASISSKIVLNQYINPSQIKLNYTFNDIVVQKINHPLIPKHITLNAVVDNVNAPDLIQLWAIQNQLNNPDLDEATADKLADKLEQQLRKICKSAIIRVSELSAFNDKAGIQMAAVATDIADNPNLDMTVSITNFDYISPAPQPIDAKKCADLKEKIDSTIETAIQYQQTCFPKPQILDDLRPYLATAAHTQNAAGLPVDTFTVSYQNNILTINGQAVKNDILPGVLQDTLSENKPDVDDITEVDIDNDNDDEMPLMPDDIDITDAEKPALEMPEPVKPAALNGFVEPTAILSAQKELLADAN